VNVYWQVGMYTQSDGVHQELSIESSDSCSSESSCDESRFSRSSGVKLARFSPACERPLRGILYSFEPATSMIALMLSRFVWNTLSSFAAACQVSQRCFTAAIMRSSHFNGAAGRF